MVLYLDENRNQQLKNILFRLAKPYSSEDEIEKVSTEISLDLTKLYHIEGKDYTYRHLYSEIFSVLRDILADDKLGDIALVESNLYYILNKHKFENEEIERCVCKLYDHVSLDVARLDYVEKKHKEAMQSGNIKVLEDNVRQLKDNVKAAGNLKTDVKKLQDSLDKSQREYIAILGIFAAIVLAFTGGMIFSTSVLENMYENTIYRIVLVVLLIGFVLFNVIFSLLYYIEKLMRNKEATLPQVFWWVNFSFALLLLCLLASWNEGLVEDRNERIDTTQNNITIKTNKT